MSYIIFKTTETSLLQLALTLLIQDLISGTPLFSEYRRSHQRCSVKKVFLEISQNSQENT